METSQSKETLREGAATVREAAERFGARRSEMMENVQEAAGDLYEQASTWMSENYGKALGIAGVLFAAGWLGYYLGRKQTPGTEEDIAEFMQEAARRMERM